MNFQLLRKCALKIANRGFGPNAGGFAHALDQQLDGSSQAAEIEQIGPQIARNLPHLLDGLGRLGCDRVNPPLAISSVRPLEQNRHILDDRQMLSQAVVKFAGDSLSFIFLRRYDLLREGALRRLAPIVLDGPDSPHCEEQAAIDAPASARNHPVW